jgi:cytochrome c oxidase assembly protein subunit 15
MGRWQGPLVVAFAATLLLGVSGAVAALGDTLSSQGIEQQALLRLRVLHPVIAVAVCAYLAVLAWVGARRLSVRNPAVALGVLLAVQLAAGFINVLLRAPVWMQILHLLLGDLVWIALVVLAAELGRADARQTAPKEAKFRGSAADIKGLTS